MFSISDIFSVAKKGRDNRREALLLEMELESTREWLADVKIRVSELLQDKTKDLCSLPDFIDTMNAVQMFLFSNFLDPTYLNKGFLQLFPEWYRVELNHAVDHLERDWMIVMTEVASLSSFDSKQDCKEFGEFYRREYAGQPSRWDICEKCTRQTTNSGPSLKQSYKQIISNPSDFEDARQRIQRNESIPDPIVKAPEMEYLKSLKVASPPPPTFSLPPRSNHFTARFESSGTPPPPRRPFPVTPRQSSSSRRRRMDQNPAP